MARLGGDMREVRPRPEHVAQGPQPRQRAHGGLLRHAQERVLPPGGLVGVVAGGLHGGAGRVDALVPRGTHIPEARVAHARRAPRRAGLSGAVGCTRKRPQSRRAEEDYILTKTGKLGRSEPETPSCFHFSESAGRNWSSVWRQSPRFDG